MQYGFILHFENYTWYKFLHGRGLEQSNVTSRTLRCTRRLNLLLELWRRSLRLRSALEVNSRMLGLGTRTSSRLLMFVSVIWKQLPEAPFVRNLVSTKFRGGCVHIVDFDTSEPNKSRCGWFFGHQAHIKMAHSDAMALPRRQRCDVCWPSKDHSSSSSGSDASDVACRKRAGISECEKVRELAPKQECRSHATSSSSSTSSPESTSV